MSQPRYVSLLQTPLDEASKKYAEEIAALPGIRDMIVFPDAFTKEKYTKASYKVTVPSSSTIISDREALYPQLRSRGTHCGMMVVALPLTRDELPNEFALELVRKLTTSIPAYLAYRLRVPYVRGTYDLTREQWNTVLVEGAPAFANMHDIPEHAVHALEYGGMRGGVTREALAQYANPSWLHSRNVRQRYRLGKYIGGNHFIEVQEVTEVHDASLGLREGQVVVMAHVGCEGVEGALRPDLRQEYIHQQEYKQVRPEEEMYEAFFTMQDAVINYVSTGRLACYAMIRDAFREVCSTDGEVKMIVERGHNGVFQENDTLVYRHNTERLVQDEYALLSGMYNHTSYIIRGGDNTHAYGSSIDHGLGKLLGRMKDTEHPSMHMVDRYRSKKGLNLLCSHDTTNFIHNTIADAYFDFMKDEGICHKAVELRPLVNIKYT